MAGMFGYSWGQIFFQLGVGMLSTALTGALAWLGHANPAIIFIWCLCALAAGLVISNQWLIRRSHLNEKNSLDRSKIRAFLAWADGYRGASSTSPIEEDRHRHIVSSEPLILQTNKRSFAFGIDNQNEAELHNSRLTFNYFGHPPLSITRTHITEEGRFWHEYGVTGTHYFYEWKNKAINGGWDHSWGSLVIEFPKPGKYRFDLAITSNEITNKNAVKTYLRVIVYDSAFQHSERKQEAE